MSIDEMPAAEPPVDAEVTDADGSAGHGSSDARRRRIGIALLVMAMAAVVAAFTLGGEEDTPGVAGGDAFHDIELTTLDGERLDFAQFEGTPVIVNFFASWCGPCRAEMPVLDALHREWDGRVVVIGLDPSDGIDAARQFVEETGATFPTALDEQAVLLERFDGFGMPTNVFVDGDGNVVDSWVGELTEEEFRNRVEEFFGVS